MATNRFWPFGSSGDENTTTATKAPEKAVPMTTSRDSSFPVELPEDAALRLSHADFAAYTRELLRVAKTDKDEQDSRELLERLELASLDISLFVEALKAVGDGQTENATEAPANMTLTENAAPAFVSTQSDLLDLFTELEKTVSGERLEVLLDAAWKVDPLTTLKIMWNARSIHLGKGEHESFYRCLGWLFQNHPATLLANLPLLYRRVIAKKAPAEGEDEADTVMVDDDSGAAPELRFGLSHGYWKDLLNVLVLAVRERLNVRENPRGVLNEANKNMPIRKLPMRARRALYVERKKQAREGKAGAAAEKGQNKSSAQLRHDKEAAMYRRAVTRFMDPAYRALHLTVARLFAAQLAKDKELLGSADKKARANISLAAKWAPSLEKFHDKNTCIASTIAETLFPEADFAKPVEVRSGETPRTAYLRVARERYRAEVLAPLRKHLAVVEIPISASAIHTVDYNTVPSLAMQTYKDLFALKDFERFFSHVERAKGGKDPRARISGAVLQPATLVAQARAGQYQSTSTSNLKTKAQAAAAIAAKRRALDNMTLDAQWKTLVQRMRDAGSLQSTIAVVDVSGSMTGPQFSDKTTPIDTAIGLGLLIAELVPAPFGGSFITFSSQPEIVQCGGVKDTRSFIDKVLSMQSANWQMNTDFNAVFEKLLLPLALKNKVAPADMVKTIVVISDMQFDSADMRDYRTGASQRWETNHERIRRLFAEHGYELPRLVYWNLRANAGTKPVTQDTESTLLVSGYSQGMLRTFMEDGGFELDVKENDPEAEEFEEVSADADGAVESKTPQRTRKVDPMAGLRKAIAHEAYKALVVVD